MVGSVGPRRAFWLCVLAILSVVGSARADELPERPLRVAVYDVAPYGGLSRDGLFVGASVDLWRRVAEDLRWRYDLTLVAQMDAVLQGLERREFDVAIGAITITPQRLSRVDFTYPSHRSGVAVALRRNRGPLSALGAWIAAAAELGPLFAVMLALLATTGVLMWRLERGAAAKGASESAVTGLRDGLYWAAVTMTTVGYGDKTPKTTTGRALAVMWMIASLALVSLLSTSLVSRITADNVAARAEAAEGGLVGRRLAAVENSSGAEYLDSLRLPFQKCADLATALGELRAGRVDAVVNSVGALQYAVRQGFNRDVEMAGGLLSPAFMGFALPANSPLKKPLDRALIRVSSSPEWRAAEAVYFGR
jgi:ABC-type amino acid transport substrate-binding protein